MDRKFGQRKQEGGSWTRTWLSIPQAVLWLRRATSFDRFQDGQTNDEQVEVGHGYTYDFTSGFQNKKERGDEGRNGWW